VSVFVIVNFVWATSLNIPISIPAYADENQGLDLGQAQNFDGVKPVSGIPTLNGCYSNSFYNTDYNILFSL
jgi:hypothetical protein